MPTTDPVTQYAQQVIVGEIVAGPDIRNTCARHLADLETGPIRGLHWDLESADRAIKFFRDVLRLNGGQFEGMPFVLLPWQAFIVGSLFGWKNADGYRRFRVAYIEAGKGSGKSPLSAAIGIYGMMADNEPRAEIYSAAAKKDQAMILFRDAVAMVDQSPKLAERIVKSGGVQVWNLAYLAKGSFFRPISSDDSQSGPRPHIALIDEIHEHRTNQIVEMMRAGTKGRRQALIFMITNSGWDRTSVCYQYHEYACKVAQGALQDDAFFSFVCSLDDGDDPLKDRSCWPKANPSLGHTFSDRYLEEQVTQAIGMPGKESIVRRLNFCQWVDAADPWIGGDLWRACEDFSFDPNSLNGQRLWCALDLSGTRDLTAVAAVADGPDGQLYAWVEYWTPGDTLQERARLDRVPYDVWIKDGYLTATPGRNVDYGYVAERLGELCAQYEVVAVAFDPYRIKYLEAELAARDIAAPLLAHPQGYYRAQDSKLWMPRSLELLEKLVMEQKLRVRFNPCLRWNSASAVVEADQKNNRIFAKRKSTGRIDGIVALAMATGCREGAEPPKKSVYATRGIISL